MTNINFVTGIHLLLTTKVSSLVLLTANLEDIKKIARQFVSETIADQIGKLFVQTNVNNFSISEENNLNNDINKVSNEDFDIPIANKNSSEDVESILKEAMQRVQEMKEVVKDVTKRQNKSVKEKHTHKNTISTKKTSNHYTYDFILTPEKTIKPKYEWKKGLNFDFLPTANIFKQNEIYNTFTRGAISDREGNDFNKINLSSDQEMDRRFEKSFKRLEPKIQRLKYKPKVTKKKHELSTKLRTENTTISAIDYYDNSIYIKKEIVATSGPIELFKITAVQDTSSSSDYSMDKENKEKNINMATQNRPYQGYPYVNPVVIDVPSIDSTTAGRWTNLPRRAIGGVNERPGTSRDSDVNERRTEVVAKDSSESDGNRTEDNPVVYIDVPESGGSSVVESPRNRNEQRGGTFVQETILYDPFKDRRIELRVTGDESDEEPSRNPSRGEQTSRPVPPNISYVASPGSSSGYTTSPTFGTSTNPNLPGLMSKEAGYYGRQTPDDMFPLGPIPVSEFPEPPPAYTEIDNVNQSNRVNVSTPPRTEVVTTGGRSLVLCYKKKKETQNGKATAAQSTQLQMRCLLAYIEGHAQMENASPTSSNPLPCNLHISEKKFKDMCEVNQPALGQLTDATTTIRPGSDRKLLQCPHCNQRVHSLVVREVGAFTHVLAMIFLVLCNFPGTSEVVNEWVGIQKLVNAINNHNKAYLKDRDGTSDWLEEENDSLSAPFDDLTGNEVGSETDSTDIKRQLISSELKQLRNMKLELERDMINKKDTIKKPDNKSKKSLGNFKMKRRETLVTLPILNDTCEDCLHTNEFSSIESKKENYKDLFNVIAKQLHVVENFVDYLKEEKTAGRQGKSEFDEILETINNKANIIKTTEATTVTDNSISMVTLLDESDIRDALKNDPLVKRIIKIAKKKRGQYMKDLEHVLT
ncbi:hypothetical protein RR46_07096 [Papilio xuthus]|uniref:LITAF domain-containing protein n=1 Tax=Papilio xuthus TaxID=66420 RepID=A0A194QAQ9_PAPXU|nr:hypothetical protein RR46_07096 [Papilio xuthus]